MNLDRFTTFKDTSVLSGNEKLYSFLATDYDISSLARKVRVSYSVRKNIISLQKNGTTNF